MRESLVQCGFLKKDEDEVQERPLPIDCWPIYANVPIPVAWLTAAVRDDPTNIWNVVRQSCELHSKLKPKLSWVKKAAEIIESLSKDKLRDIEIIESSAEDKLTHMKQIVSGLKRASRMDVVCLFVPRDVLTASSAQEEHDGPSDDMDGRENIANVEQLFHRLNAGGVRLEGDDLTYSMIKAYWDNLEERISQVARRHMPELRLATLAFRVALSSARPHKKNAVEPKRTDAIPAPIAVADIRKLARAGEDLRIKQKKGVRGIKQKKPFLSS